MPAPIIGGKDDVGVLQFACLLQCIKHTGQGQIHFLHHGCIGNLFICFPFGISDWITGQFVHALGIESRIYPTLFGSLKRFSGTHEWNVRGIV